MPPSAIPEPVRAGVEECAGRIVTMHLVGGGCIANASRVETATGALFLKWANGAAGAGFAGEAAGLRALAATAPGEIAVPRPLAAEPAVADGPGFLLTEWIEPGSPGPAHWATFGAALATLHRTRPPGGGRFGFETDTFCGPTRQTNLWMDNWPAFFRDRRLVSMAERLRSVGRWESGWNRAFDELLAGMADRLPARPTPALLHGDLWSGNAFPAADGRTALVDPACYVGDREADLAMTELFGGFDTAFYDAYADAWPLESGYPVRRGIYNLYHMMNHLLLFGAGYAGAVDVSIRELVG